MGSSFKHVLWMETCRRLVILLSEGRVFCVLFCSFGSFNVFCYSALPRNLSKSKCWLGDVAILQQHLSWRKHYIRFLVAFGWFHFAKHCTSGYWHHPTGASWNPLRDGNIPTWWRDVLAWSLVTWLLALWAICLVHPCGSGFTKTSVERLRATLLSLVAGGAKMIFSFYCSTKIWAILIHFGIISRHSSSLQQHQQLMGLRERGWGLQLYMAIWVDHIFQVTNMKLDTSSSTGRSIGDPFVWPTTSPLEISSLVSSTATKMSRAEWNGDRKGQTFGDGKWWSERECSFS